MVMISPSVLVRMSGVRWTRQRWQDTLRVMKTVCRTCQNSSNSVKAFLLFHSELPDLGTAAEDPPSARRPFALDYFQAKLRHRVVPSVELQHVSLRGDVITVTSPQRRHRRDVIITPQDQSSLDTTEHQLCAETPRLSRPRKGRLWAHLGLRDARAVWNRKNSKSNSGRARWRTPVIQATREAESGGSRVQSQPQQLSKALSNSVRPCL